MSERSNGDRWAGALRAAGYWVQKLPASSMSGLPDWLVGKLTGGGHYRGPRFVEAKSALDERDHPHVAYRSSQISMAQEFFLDRWIASGGNASVVVLDDDGYVELDWRSAREPLPRNAFDAMKVPYNDG